MVKRIPLLALVIGAQLALAHPMGNFSVSHYARFQVKQNSVDLIYVLDLAELPTFDLLRQWGLDRDSPRLQLQRKATEQAREWARHLEITSAGRALTPRFTGADLVVADGAGDLPIMRITSRLRLDSQPGTLEYEDHNYAGRAGWKEIVIEAGSGASLVKASQSAQDRSKALTEYPADPATAPPQDLRASLEWSAPRPVVVAQKIQQIPQPAGPPAVAPPVMTAKAAQPGSVVKGDYLSRLLHRRELSLGMILIAIAAAFGLGAAHALTPGHGKTIVAAYLVGSRGTLKHAAYLGAMVTFTHTVSVFVLGLATLFLFQYVMPEKITQVLGVVSGLSIVAIGAWMLYRRLKAAHQRQAGHVHTHAHVHAHQPELVHAHAPGRHHGHSHDHESSHVHSHAGSHAHSHDHSHSHDHDHDHGHTHEHGHHPHAHDHGHDHSHDHAHGKLVHSHGPGGAVHSHDVPDEITWGSLTALAVSGGLVPCESALVLLLSAIALGRVGLGLMLLVAFSIGLAIVLVAIGVLVIYAKNLFPARAKSARHPAFRWIPVGSAAVVMTIGLLMTAVSLGWVQSKWMI